MNTVVKLTVEQRMITLERGHDYLAVQMAEIALSLQEINSGLQERGKRLAAVELELKTNSATTQEVRDILATARAGLKVLGGIGQVVRWMGYLSAAAASVYGFLLLIKHGGKPPGL